MNTSSDPDEFGQEIYDRTRACISRFKEWLGSHEASTFRDAVDGHGKSLEVWAAFSGVMARPNLSLDYRLRKDEKFKASIVNLLDLILESLDVLQSGDAAAHAGDDVDEDPATLEKDMDDSAMLALERSILTLHDVAMVIRRSRFSNTKFNTSPSFAKIDGYYEPYYEQTARVYIKMKFPKAKPSLRDQIVKAMSQRRSWLIYQIRRGMRLAERRDATEAPEAPAPLPYPVAAPTAYSIRQQGGSVPKAKDSPAQSKKKPQFHPSLISASVPAARPLIPTAPRITRTIISRNKGFAIVDSDYVYPPVPEPQPGTSVISCSYCRELLTNPAQPDLSEDRWRLHHDEDVLPFFCLSENCTRPIIFFQDVIEWADHMVEKHTRHWCEVIHSAAWECDIKHDKSQMFYTQEDFVTHLEKNHDPKPSGLQAKVLIKRKKVEEFRAPFTCPLCEIVVEGRGLQEVAKHVARHLHSLLSVCVPNLTLDTREDGNGDGASDEAVVDSTESFPEPEHPLREQLLSIRHPGLPAEKSFFPRGSIEEFLTEKIVFGFLRDMLHEDLEDFMVRRYTERICGTGEGAWRDEEGQPIRLLKILTILIIIEQATKITRFVVDGVLGSEYPTDEDLPLALVTVGDDDIASLVRHGGGEGPPYFFRGWKKDILKEFVQAQWEVTVPSFTMGSAVGPTHYDLDDSTILPFTEGPTFHRVIRDRLDKANPVSWVEIHPQHFDWGVSQEPCWNSTFGIRYICEASKAGDTCAEFITQLRQISHDHLVSILMTFQDSEGLWLAFPRTDTTLIHYWAEMNPEPAGDYTTILWMVEQWHGIINGMATIHKCLQDARLSHCSGKPPGSTLALSDCIGAHNIQWFENPTSDRPELAPFGTLKVSSFVLDPSVNWADSYTVYVAPEFVRRAGQRGTKRGATTSTEATVWSIGCLTVEWITWMCGGWTLYQNFKSIRSMEVNNYQFFAATEAVPPIVTLKQCVVEFVQQLHTHPRCTHLMHDILDFVERDVLVIIKILGNETDHRLGITKVERIASGWLDRVRSDVDYASKPSPWPVKKKERGESVPKVTASFPPRTVFSDPTEEWICCQCDWQAGNTDREKRCRFCNHAKCVTCTDGDDDCWALSERT